MVLVSGAFLIKDTGQNNQGYNSDYDINATNISFRNALYYICLFILLFNILSMFFGRRQTRPQGFYVKDKNGNMYYMADDGQGNYSVYDKYKSN